MADTLRSVPGVNVIQMSARDINLTRTPGDLDARDLAARAVDGRSVYLDFFGLVLWDLVPSPTSGEIKQIEVVRGPASVVWGANAVNGVVNIITKTPRENEGFGLVLRAGCSTATAARARGTATATSSTAASPTPRRSTTAGRIG